MAALSLRTNRCCRGWGKIALSATIGEDYPMPRFTHNGADLYYELDGSGPPAVYAVGYSGHSNGVLDVILRQTLTSSSGC
jgi:hypothetical protein